MNYGLASARYYRRRNRRVPEEGQLYHFVR